MGIKFGGHWILLLALLAGCEELKPPPQLADKVLGGLRVEAAKLEAGRRVYQSRCRSCHGDFGDGMGPLGYQQRPQAADLRRGLIKFASVPAGQLPLDSDIERVLRGGLKGTAMLAWPLADEEVQSVIQYIKTFSERWTDELAGVPVSLHPDPWPVSPSGKAAAIERGKSLLNGSVACQSCHGENSREKHGAPSLTSGTFKAGETGVDLYRVIAAGIGGTAMPSWEGALAPKDIWALVHYLKHIRDE